MAWIKQTDFDRFVDGNKVVIRNRWTHCEFTIDEHAANKGGSEFVVYRGEERIDVGEISSFVGAKRYVKLTLDSRTKAN